MSTSQVRIQLTTRSPDIELPEESSGPILVSTELRRYQLSTLVNNLLATEQPVPFEFLINGQFLRTSIDEFLTANGISAETTLNVEYVRALVPPSHVASFEHDDWVSSVDLLSATSAAGRWAGKNFGASGVGNERLVSASYDGLLRLWNQSKEVLATSGDGGHSGPVKSVKFLDHSRLVSSSVDRSVRIWNYNDREITPKVELLGHTASVDRLAVHTPSQRILTASQDHTVGIFSSDIKSNPSAPAHLLPNPSSKRRKPSVTVPQRGALSLLAGHNAPVSDVTFKPDDATVAYSTSWDHTLKTWDLATHSCVDTRATSHPLVSVAALPQLNLVAAGTTARHISLIDPRASATAIVAMTLRGHNNAVVSLAPSPDNGFVFASGGHDGSVRVWDVRNAKAGNAGGVAEGGMTGESIFVLERDGQGEKKPVGGEGIKVFGVQWDEAWGIVSCGEDKKVQVNQPR
ncbi:ribosome biogenesis protein ytm1 [Aureobasidium pullulans]|uniref:Ribosome biogenesis protein YTM1 n=2 Tax=Aureobasidium pullulans TaxID=5580 RepID=A0A074XT54_AURPU|nr:ribosome biogenesis protein ytm1 [Aureobasidium pullulans EXF-150]THV64504.1 ribosome biogenesis protein ytm1 [Aureobasidium pullulans]KEQ85137.1 ribosome biogenesis protein ytm1 [Aureobasidium pullulans EXF-150]THV68001.1 ribosome biogenesis protein ytm1 [Aureobasidium pullulans]THW83135.1 ribosome biogenesis protein ytm1 [Aureobasidium pullulans]THX22796.1 ribosome biogenesis protein ytm1 [Aureobasidium pullulans]